MKQLQRYYDSTYQGMAPHSDGDWVEYEEAQAAITEADAEIARLKDELERISASASDQVTLSELQAKRIAELEGALRKVVILQEGNYGFATDTHLKLSTLCESLKKILPQTQEDA